MHRVSVFAYGVFCYAVFFGTFLYAVAFVGGFLVPRTLEGAPGRPTAVAVAIDAGLLVVFGLQHSVMARPAFKRWWTGFVPEPAERSTYVLLSSLALVLLFVFWEPLVGTIWDVESPVLRAGLWVAFACGWLTVLVTTFLINHFDLFGLRQVWLYLRGRPYTALPFGTPGPYSRIRHPLYVGWLLAFWETPTMTAGHLFFALAMTGYILLAIRFEERDLVGYYGETYAEYRRRVPMLIPRLRGRRAAPAAATAPLSAAGS